MTGLTLADFHKLTDAGVFHARNMDEAIWQFRLFERASLHYLGIDTPDEPEKVGMWAHTVETDPDAAA